MKIRHFKFTKEQLDNIPEKERTLLIIFSHAANEVNVLLKAMYFSAQLDDNKTENDQFLTYAWQMNMLTFQNLLAGKLNEIWVVLDSHFIDGKLDEIYNTYFDCEQKAALENLKTYFALKNNPIYKIRNKFGFHYDYKLFAKGYVHQDEDVPLDVYLSERPENNMYTFAESLTSQGFIRHLNHLDKSKGFVDFVDDLHSIVKSFECFVQGFIIACINKNLGEDFNFNLDEMHLMNQPNFEAVSIPFFVEFPKK